MIEFCTVRRMIFTIGILGIITVVSVIVESRLELKDVETSKEMLSKATELSVAETNGSQLTENSLTCLTSDDIKIAEQCRKCKPWETDKPCGLTGYIEKVQCALDDHITKYNSCPEPGWLRQRSFWIHEGVWVLVGIISYLFVHMRRSALDQKLMDKINQQIASGV